MGLISTTADYYYTYKFLKLLVAKWTDLDAYKLGIIDEHGKLLKHPITSAEKESYTPFTRIAVNIKRALGMIPIIGKKRITTLATALVLLREHESAMGLSKGVLTEAVAIHIRRGTRTPSQLMEQAVASDSPIKFDIDASVTPSMIEDVFHGSTLYKNSKLKKIFVSYPDSIEDSELKLQRNILSKSPDYSNYEVEQDAECGPSSKEEGWEEFVLPSDCLKEDAAAPMPAGAPANNMGGGQIANPHMNRFFGVTDKAPKNRIKKAKDEISGH